MYNAWAFTPTKTGRAGQQCLLYLTERGVGRNTVELLRDAKGQLVDQIHERDSAPHRVAE